MSQRQRQQRQRKSLAKELEENKIVLQELFKADVDITYRELTVGGREALIVYIADLIDSSYLSSTVIKPLMELSFFHQEQEKEITLEYLYKNVLSTSKVDLANDFEDVTKGILAGQGILFLEGSCEALLLSTKAENLRAIEPPVTEVNVRGPREGFVEDIGVNVSMLRRKLKNENLRLEEFNLGARTSTVVYMAYIEDLVKPQLVEEVRQRIQRIEIKGVLDSGYIEQIIDDNPKSFFPTVGSTEKPDKLAGKLLDGRIGILVDGSPFALTIPYLFIEAFQNTEDYSVRPFFVSIIRILRLMGFYFTTMLPAFYVALQGYHQEMLPTTLLVNMSSGREGTPFPVIIEVFIMGVIFEILREAGIRMPRTVGQAVSIVGALVLGESAVQAGIVGPNIVIVVALTAISGFLTPSLNATISILRTYFLISTAFLGMFGWILSLMAVLIHLNSLRSFGIPYLSPIIPFNEGDMKDGFLRFPLLGIAEPPSLLPKNPSQVKDKRSRNKK